MVKYLMFGGGNSATGGVVLFPITVPQTQRSSSYTSTLLSISGGGAAALGTSLSAAASSSSAGIEPDPQGPVVSAQEAIDHSVGSGRIPKRPKPSQARLASADGQSTTALRPRVDTIGQSTDGSSSPLLFMRTMPVTQRGTNSSAGSLASAVSATPVGAAEPGPSTPAAVIGSVLPIQGGLAYR